MVRILRIDVDGLAARRDSLSLEFKSGINILYGLNGTGKTSLLRLLYSALSDDIALIRRVPFIEARVEFRAGSEEEIIRTISADTVATKPMPTPQTIVTATGPITLPMVGPQNAWTSTAAPGTNFAPSYLTIFRLFGGDPMQQFWSGGPESPYSETRLNQQFFQLVANRWTNYSNQLLTKVRALQDDGIAAVLESLFSSPRRSTPATVDADKAYEQVRHFLVRRGMKLDFTRKTFVQRYAEDPKVRKAVDHIQNTEQRITHVEEPRQQLESLVNRFISTNKHVIFSEGPPRVQTDQGEISIELLSSGEKHLLRILVECLASESNCILIDEPELSLHIDWQHELPRALITVNPAAQVIMATHSPDIMADVPDNRIFEL